MRDELAARRRQRLIRKLPRIRVAELGRVLHRLHCLTGRRGPRDAA
jgi:hypothetical protein